MSSLTSRRLKFSRSACLLLLIALIGACSKASAPELPPIQARGTLSSLLAHRDQLRIVEQRQDFRVRPRLFKPLRNGTDEYGEYPALEVSPPSEVRYEVPASHPRAILRVASCIHAGEYRGEGEVRFEYLLDGEEVLVHRLSSSGDLPFEERRWHFAELPIGEGGRLTIRTRYQGDQEIAPRAAVGLLQIAVPFEVERQPADPERPNVLVILIDALRADRLHTYGNPKPTSPVIDRLAEGGVRYENAYSSTAWTVPSTASLLTGMSPAEHGIGFGNTHSVSDSITTLAEAFQYEGFTTAGFSCNPLVSPAHGFDQGFEHFTFNGWKEASQIQGQVEVWLRENRDRRFFLYLHFIDPHYPYDPAEPFREKFAGPPPEGFQEIAVNDQLKEFYQGTEWDAEVLRRISEYQLALYDAEIAEVDTVIGRLLELLDELGVGQQTIVAVTGDHGEEFLEHGWAGHHNQLFDESVRVPLILHGPGIPAGVVRSERVENRFLGGTLLRLCEAELPSNLRGFDLIDPGLAGTLADTPVFLSNSNGRWANLDERSCVKLGKQYSVLHGTWRFNSYPNVEGGEPFVTLYDLTLDPGAYRDVADGHPELVETMQRRIERWIREGQESRPALIPAMEETTRMLQAIGYIEVDAE